jgi:hypothetical protein
MILFSKAGNRNCPLVQRHGVALQALEIALFKVICPNTSAKSPHHATAAWTAAGSSFQTFSASPDCPCLLPGQICSRAFEEAHLALTPSLNLDGYLLDFSLCQWCS